VNGEQSLVPTFGPVEARRLTDEAKRDITALRERLLLFYEGQAHLALGFKSWGEYWQTEFETSWRTGYRELEAARVNRAIDPWDNGNLPERQARELAPLLRQEDEDTVIDLWVDLRDEFGERLTVNDVREAVQKKLKPKASQAVPTASVSRSVRGDELARAKRTLSAAYGKAAGLIADWLEEHPEENHERVCKQVAPLGWQGLLMRIERGEKS
jgi:hypothetical protein